MEVKESKRHPNRFEVSFPNNQNGYVLHDVDQIVRLVLKLFDLIGLDKPADCSLSTLFRLGMQDGRDTKFSSDKCEVHLELIDYSENRNYKYVFFHFSDSNFATQFANEA